MSHLTNVEWAGVVGDCKIGAGAALTLQLRNRSADLAPIREDDPSL